MLELTAAQTLIALPKVGRITAIGLASAVFTYYLVKLLVKPYIDVKLAVNPYREFATNAATAILAVLVSIALQIIAGAFLPAAAPILEAPWRRDHAHNVPRIGQKRNRLPAARRPLRIRKTRPGAYQRQRQDGHLPPARPGVNGIALYTT